jgi:hypothetical protein
MAARMKKLPVHIYEHAKRCRTEAAHVMEIQHQVTSANFRSKLAKSVPHEFGLSSVKEDIFAGQANLNDARTTFHY